METRFCEEAKESNPFGETHSSSGDKRRGLNSGNKRRVNSKSCVWRSSRGEYTVACPDSKETPRLVFRVKSTGTGQKESSKQLGGATGACQYGADGE